jgi:hypothetical protein
MMTKEEALKVTAVIRNWVDGIPVDAIETAYHGEVWRALGYESWTQWCDKELHHGLRLPVPERNAVSRRASSARHVEPRYRRSGGGIRRHCAQ